MSSPKVVHAIEEVSFGDYIYRGALTSTSYSNVPFLTWLDGTPCNEANMYVLELLQRNMSTKGRGGSIRQYAFSVSRIIRYCDDKKISLVDLSDGEFVEFVKSLRLPKSEPSLRREAPTENTVIANGRVVLDFFAYLDRALGGRNLVGPKGRIKAYRKVVASPTSEGGSVQREYWDHRCFGAPSPVRRRSPIAKETIDVLYQAAAEVSKNNYVVRRRQLLIRILEISGARAGEVALLKVVDVSQAVRSNARLLTFYTLKRRKEFERQLPVLAQDLADVINFIEIFRRPLIRRKLGQGKDHGFLFVSEKTGEPLSAQSLSNEIGLLRRHAKLTSKASAHLFRHRFITRLLIHLIEEHKFAHSDDLRTALREVEAFKQILIQWTGQATTRSLEPYIDLAFDEWKGLKETMQAVDARRANEGFADQIDKLVHRLGRDLSSEEFKEAYEQAKKNLEDDLRPKPR